MYISVPLCTAIMYRRLLKSYFVFISSINEVNSRTNFSLMSLWLNLAYFLNLLIFKKTTFVSNNFTLAFQHD